MSTPLKRAMMRAPDRLAPVKRGASLGGGAAMMVDTTGPKMLASVRSAPLKSARMIQARSSRAPLRLAPTNFAPTSLAPKRSQRARSAWLKSSPLRSSSLRFLPERSAACSAVAAVSLARTCSTVRSAACAVVTPHSVAASSVSTFLAPHMGCLLAAAGSGAGRHRLPGRQRLARRGNIVHADDLNALAHAVERAGDGARHALLGRHGAADAADQPLARQAQHDAAAQGVEQRETRHDLEIMRRALAEADAGIDDDARARDARRDTRLDAPGEVFQHIA